MADSREDFEGIVMEYSSNSLYDDLTDIFASAREQAEFMHGVVMHSCFRYFELCALIFVSIDLTNFTLDLGSRSPLFPIFP